MSKAISSASGRRCSVPLPPPQEACHDAKEHTCGDFQLRLREGVGPGALPTPQHGSHKEDLGASWSFTELPVPFTGRDMK